jgi:hypothetical protein
MPAKYLRAVKVDIFELTCNVEELFRRFFYACTEKKCQRCGQIKNNALILHRLKDKYDFPIHTWDIPFQKQKVFCGSNFGRQ